MTEIIRERDVIVLVKGSTQPVLVSSLMVQQGWPGGQGVTWTDATDDTFLVTYSDGTYGGFLYEGSDELSNQLISSIGGYQKYKYATLCAGSWVISTSTYERYTWQSRQAGPLVPIVYTVGDRLRFSLRGYLTNQDEWSQSGDPRAGIDLFIGTVAQVPSAANKLYLTAQTSI